MARTVGSKNKITKHQSPEASFNKLTTIEQLVTYYYWLFLKTEGAEGWDNTKSGTREHWRHFKVIHEHWKTPGGFYNQARVRTFQ